jgi:hypothetical protein
LAVREIPTDDRADPQKRRTAIGSSAGSSSLSDLAKNRQEMEYYVSDGCHIAINDGHIVSLLPNISSKP